MSGATFGGEMPRRDAALARVRAGAPGGRRAGWSVIELGEFAK
jgi:hypothetical protein